MKSLLPILFIFLMGNILFGQRVNTVAGQLGMAGSIDGEATTSSFNNPHGLALDKDGNIYVADRYNHTIRKITQDGVVSTIAGTPGVKGSRDGMGTNALLNEPWGIAVNNENEILVADTKNNKIRKISPEGFVSTLAGSGDFGTDDGVGVLATFGNPTGIESDSEGRIYIADHLTHIIRVIELSGQVSTLAGMPNENGDADGQGNAARFWRPYGLAIDQEDNVLVADEWNHKIRKITPDGWVTTVAGTGSIGHTNGIAKDAEFKYPWDVSVDDTGNLYVGDGYNYIIRIISSDGRVNNFAGDLLNAGAIDGFAYDAQFSGVTALDWCASDGKIYLADAYNNLIRTVDEHFNQVGIVNDSETDEPCYGDTILLRSSILLNNQWYRNGAQIENAFTNQLQVTQSGIYQVANYGNDGDLIFSNEIEVSFRPPLNLDFSADEHVTNVAEPITFSANRNDLLTYKWQFGASSDFSDSDFRVVKQFPTIGVYDILLIGTDVFGCEEVILKENYIKIEETISELYFPTAFSPNNDGKNDVFKPRGNLPTDYELFIFDQWGTQVFHTKNAATGWDGTFKNQPIVQGNFAFIATFSFGGEMGTKSGVISLLR